MANKNGEIMEQSPLKEGLFVCKKFYFGVFKEIN
jgi:hypothetical protein